MTKGHVESTDFRRADLPIRDQRGLLSCVAISFVDAVSLARPDLPPLSTGFVYYHARKLLLHEHHNVGVEPLDVIRAIDAHGICPERFFPDHDPDYRSAPPRAALQAATGLPRPGFVPVQTSAAAVIQSLKEGCAVVVCLRFFSSNLAAFIGGSTARDGAILWPAPDEEPVQNHAMLCVGHDACADRLLFRNSLGAGWGDAGHAWLPSAYLDAPDHAFGFWRVRPRT